MSTVPWYRRIVDPRLLTLRTRIRTYPYSFLLLEWLTQQLTTHQHPQHYVDIEQWLLTLIQEQEEEEQEEPE